MKFPVVPSLAALALACASTLRAEAPSDSAAEKSDSSASIQDCARAVCHGRER